MGELQNLMSDEKATKVLSDTVKDFGVILMGTPDKVISHYKVKTWIHDLADEIIIRVGMSVSGVEKTEAREFYEKLRMDSKLKEELAHAFIGIGLEIDEFMESANE